VLPAGSAPHIKDATVNDKSFHTNTPMGYNLQFSNPTKKNRTVIIANPERHVEQAALIPIHQLDCREPAPVQIALDELPIDDIARRGGLVQSTTQRAKGWKGCSGATPQAGEGVGQPDPSSGAVAFRTADGQPAGGHYRDIRTPTTTARPSCGAGVRTPRSA
jgi:hypothetical protein